MLAPLDVGPEHMRRLGHRTAWLATLSILVAGALGVAVVQGLGAEAQLRAHVGTQARAALIAALRGVAQQASSVGVPSTRVLTANGGQPFYVVDFASPRYRTALMFDVERWTLQYINDDGHDPPVHLNSLLIHERGWATAEATLSLTIPGFLGRAQTILVSGASALPHYVSRYGWQTRP